MKIDSAFVTYAQCCLSVNDLERFLEDGRRVDVLGER
jgi:hypothetical protein